MRFYLPLLLRGPYETFMSFLTISNQDFFAALSSQAVPFRGAAPCTPEHGLPFCKSPHGDSQPPETMGAKLVKWSGFILECNFL